MTMLIFNHYSYIYFLTCLKYDAIFDCIDNCYAISLLFAIVLE